ncbi:hypothetical protein NC652_029310 [Populus alba x Populus x berolinensis]|nr:hypothetical protein NC652_029310 [Populus alba x Populus x berolinensis]
MLKATMSSAISELNGKEMMGLIRYGKSSSSVLLLEFHEELEYMEAAVSSLASEVKFSCSVANIVETLTL